MPSPTSKPDTARKIKIFINDEHYEAPQPVMAGRELLALAGLPETNQLFLEVPGPKDDQPVRPDEPIELRPGMKFYDVPVGTFG